MRRLFALSLVAGALALSACDRQATEPGAGSLGGTWKYRATGFQMWATHPATCEIETTYVFRMEGNDIEGVSDEAGFTCTDATNGHTWTSTQPAGVVRGEVRDGRVYITNAGGWHSFGEIQPGRVDGYLESYGGYAGQPMQTVMSGSFTMERISHQVYGGPRA